MTDDGDEWRKYVHGVANPRLKNRIRGRVSVLRWRRCNRLCTSGFMDDVMFQWRSQDLEVGAQGVSGTEVPQWGPGAEPLVGGSGGA